MDDLLPIDWDDPEMYQQAAAHANVPMDDSMERLYELIVELTGQDLIVPTEYRAQLHDDQGRLIEARNVGYALHQIGGLEAMRAVAYRLFYRGPGTHYGDLQRCWNGIGDWNNHTEEANNDDTRPDEH